MSSDRPKNIKKKVLVSRLILAGGLVVLALVVLAFSREMAGRIKINEEIAQLQAEIEKYESSNSELEDLIQYFSTKNYQEKEARRKLSLSKSGEQVVSISTPEIKRETPNEIIQRDIAQEQVEERVVMTNPQKWWAYFFKKE